VVNVVQLGVLALLPGPDFNDMRIRGGTDIVPLGIGTGASNGPLLVLGRIPALRAPGMKVAISVAPDAHAHLLLPTIHGIPVIHAVS
jgi:hypothetical protein